MQQNRDELCALLRQWRDIEPSRNFESNVRRRIRLTATTLDRPWFWRPAFWPCRPAFAAAVAVSIIIGSAAGVFSVKRGWTEMQFMSPGTLAGSYVQ
jgi:hypothetical protein